MVVDEAVCFKDVETAKWLCGVWWFDSGGVVLLADDWTESCVNFGSDSFLERRDAGSGSGGDEVSSFVK